MDAFPKMKKSLIPSRLAPGATIGIAAPASPFDPTRLQRGADILKEMGFRVVMSEIIFKKKGYLAGSDQQRAMHLNQLFADDSIDAIVCARGGYGALRLLPLIDFETIKNHPKLCVGFSDITGILSSLYSKCGLVTVHGPMATTLDELSPDDIDRMKALFYTGKMADVVPEKAVTINSGCVTAPITGGNLATLNHLTGTPYEADFAGHILFLEDVGESLYKIDRMLMQMKLAGCFDGITGVMLGTFEQCGRIEAVHELMARFFSEFNIPVLAGFDSGHGKRNGVLPLGLRATIDADRQRLSFCETL